MDSLGDRMKSYYENAYRIHITRRTPAILRIDGKAFHTFTKGFDRPYDMIFKHTMWQTAKYLCENIQNTRIAYVQSDEISILLIDYNKFTTSAWFDGNIQKMVSVSASMATMAFNRFFREETESTFRSLKFSSEDMLEEKRFNLYRKKFNSAMFDSRVFNLPESEVCNYFIWRQQDATRNSIETLGRCHFSDKELFGVNCSQIQDKLMTEKGVNWNDCPVFYKRGMCVIRKENEDTGHSEWMEDLEIPVFSQDREYIEKHLEVEEK